MLQVVKLATEKIEEFWEIDKTAGISLKNAELKTWVQTGKHNIRDSNASNGKIRFMMCLPDFLGER